MTAVLISTPAESDLEAIVDYLAANAGTAVAAQYAQKLDRAFEHLALHPQTGSPRRGRDRKIRQWLVAPFIVFYSFEVDDKHVRVIRVLH